MSVPVVLGGAERAFRLADIVTDRVDVSGSMAVGGWLNDRHGTAVAGSLGVLVDDVLGYSLVRARPDGLWSVSGEISIEVLTPLTFDAAVRSLQATTVGAVRTDGLGGHVAGVVSDATGEVVATCAQRGRWIPFDGTFADVAGPAADLSGATCVEDLLGGTPHPVEGGASLELTVGPVLTNPLGNLHGGLSLCASDLAASTAVRSWPTPWATESLRIQYLRPVPAGSHVEFRALVRHAGRTRAVVEVSGVVEGKLCTLAHLTGRPLAAGQV